MIMAYGSTVRIYKYWCQCKCWLEGQHKLHISTHICLFLLMTLRLETSVSP